MKVKIYHDRQACINCKSCTMLAPTHFGDDENGEVVLIGGKEEKDLVFVKEVEVDEAQLEEIKSAAESCPVGAIKYKVEK